MPLNFRLHEKGVGGVGIPSRDTDSRHYKGQKRQDFGDAVLASGYFLLDSGKRGKLAVLFQEGLGTSALKRLLFRLREFRPLRGFVTTALSLNADFTDLKRPVPAPLLVQLPIRHNPKLSPRG